MRRNFRSFLLIVILLLTVGLISLAILRLSEKSGIVLKEGDELVQKAEYITAREKYILAARIWPLIKVTKAYRQRIFFLDQVDMHLTNNQVVVVYLKGDANKTDVDRLLKKLQTIEGVREARLMTEEKISEKYKDEIGSKTDEDPSGSVTLSDMQSSIEIYLTNADAIEEVFQYVETSEVVDSVEESSF